MDELQLMATSVDGESITVTAKVSSLNETLAVLERFLLGAGFVFNGTLEIVAPESPLQQRFPD